MKKKIPLEQILIKGSTYRSHDLKLRLVKEGVFEQRCFHCPVTTTWNGKPISLHLDHIDGDHSNNELSNLRLLCPNCHSQTATYSGKKNRKVVDYRCTKCNGKATKHSKSGLCTKCNHDELIQKQSKKPNDLQLVQKQVSEMGYTATGRLYSVTPTTVKRWISGMRA